MALHLRTERLVLRPVDAGDVDALHALHTDDEVMRYLSRERARREDVRDEVLPRMLAWERRDPAWGYSAAVEPATGAFLGWLLLRPAVDREPEPGELEIGWRFARAAWGRGYATEAARAVLHHAVTALGARSVFATTMAANTASRRVMEKIGMRHVRSWHEHHDDPLPGAEQGDVEYRHP
ncbi:GNAT family N-acetyltransferase [Pseudonocardia sp. KRD-184]|uniref:GNAT family N-acetyltransferase n=1 Tax=Pseudonocardia oceani TaxID=2792013 RepID=A0ABS6UI51_9PSEU|nr:GNAT family N-acetyltransferase [Pseudonocardia oceani]MBW0089098.1 GNAT family N-acetyltransferase [Pseudonocardia oceani]MBW0096011.1 GNAT family N-acetyltransferase [Pseudonocardia oceani]MBW0108622.1 GNAT family N-acetyltransferase [Pseudonocardia oceani]MBW0121868.1 GNAT family N-acetyltransferase [Pseudonocardia oceani]MBW0131937.1 GNAT family N-acetyltransferase [Pseudonocardia oceani]